MMIPIKATPWTFKDLHKKIGQFVYIEPGESDICEGNYLEQLLFRDERNNLYLIAERDVRGSKPASAVDTKGE